MAVCAYSIALLPVFILLPHMGAVPMHKANVVPPRVVSSELAKVPLLCVDVKLVIRNLM